MLRRNSRYLIFYFFWLFSKRDLSIEKFIQKYIIFDNNIKYPLIVKNLSDNRFLLKNNKLILKSQNELDHLIFMLELQLTKDQLYINNLKNKAQIESYFINRFDFKAFSHQNIFNLNSFEIISQNEQINNIIFNYIDPSKKSFYFQNDLIDHHIYWAKSTNKIANTEESFILYVYQSQDSIKKYNFKLKIKSSLKYLLYKFNDEARFLILY
jgi:hypothetical protein